MISNILIVLANLEAVWLVYILSEGIARYGATTGLTRLAGFQVVVSAIMAFVFLFLTRRQSKHDFQKLAFVATAFAILGLCAAIVGAYPFLIGKVISP
jgi:hypothetical protein